MSDRVRIQQVSPDGHTLAYISGAPRRRGGSACLVPPVGSTSRPLSPSGRVTEIDASDRGRRR